MPTPTHVKWYETSDKLDSDTISYKKSPTPVISIVQGRVFANWDSRCDCWKIKWERVRGRFEYHFQLENQADLKNPLLAQLPIMSFEYLSQWQAARSIKFNFKQSLNNRVGQLLRFAREKLVSGPEGTLFVVSRPGIQKALEENTPCNMVLGYSLIEPENLIPCQPMSSQPPNLSLPDWISVIKPPEPIRVSRYARSWVI